MANTVAQMTKEELREMLENLIEQKLLSCLATPMKAWKSERRSGIGFCDKGRQLLQVNVENSLKT